MLRYGIPQYRLPKVEVLEAEYESVTRLGGKIVCNQGLGPRLHARRPPEPGLRRGPRRDRLLRHEQARRAGRGRRGGPRRPRVPADRDARPAVPGPRRQARRRHRRRLHLDGLLADVGPPGRRRGHARLPPRHEGHAGRERGPRGDRGRRPGDLPGGPDPGHHRRQGQRHRRRVHPDAARRARRLRSPPAGARARARSSSIPCDRVLLAIGQGPDLSWIGPGSTGGVEATKQRRLKADAVTFETGPARRLRDRRRPDRRGDGRPGGRRGPPRGLRRWTPTCKGLDLAGDPDAPAARRAAARVPLDRAVHERGQGAALPAQGDGRRGPQPAATSSTSSRTRRPRPSPSRPAASSAPARRSATATCAASASSTGRRSRRSSRSTTRAPATGA